MSEPRSDRGVRRSVAIALAALTLAPSLGGAQSTADARQELDSLLPHWHAAKLRLADAEAARRRAASTISISRGHLRILADSGISQRVAAAAAVASASLERVFGEEARRMADHPIVVRQNPLREGQTRRLIRVRWSAAEAYRGENSPLGFPRDLERTVTGDVNADAHADLAGAL